MLCDDLGSDSAGPRIPLRSSLASRRAGVSYFAVVVELLLERLLVLLAVGTVTCAFGEEGDCGTCGAGGFYWNVA